MCTKFIKVANLEGGGAEAKQPSYGPRCKNKTLVGRHGLTDKSVDLSTRRQGSMVRIPVSAKVFCLKGPKKKSRRKVAKKSRAGS